MLEARFFSGAGLFCRGQPVDGPAGRRHPLALVAVLSAHSAPVVGRDKLAALLWPERDAHAARHLLSEALYVLRRALGPDAIPARGDTLSLDRARVRTDVGDAWDASRRGDHAAVVEAYSGPFLDGFHLPGSSEFEEWQAERRAFFAAQDEESLYALADRAEIWGDHREAVRWLRLRVAQDPLSSHAAHRLMLALARSGDRAAAIRVAREHTRLLERELGLPGAPCVHDLERVLAGAAPVDLTAIPRCGAPGSGCPPEESSYARKGFGALRP